MVTIETTADRRDGVTLVTATVTDEAAPTRVTVESRLDGPVWPPRRQGTPAAGWEENGGGAHGIEEKDGVTGFEGVVPADGRLAIGFATPGEPRDPPVAVTTVEPADGADDELATPAAVLRGLGDPSPPSLIEADRSSNDDPAVAPPAESDGNDDGEVDDSRESPDRDSTADGDNETKRPKTIDRQATTASSVSDPGQPLPPVLADWLATAERRIERGERLEATASIEDATAALRQSGGVAGARALDGRLRTDAEQLRTLATRAQALADRAESATVATDALDRLV